MAKKLANVKNSKPKKLKLLDWRTAGKVDGFFSNIGRGGEQGPEVWEAETVRGNVYILTITVYPKSADEDETVDIPVLIEPWEGTNALTVCVGMSLDEIKALAQQQHEQAILSHEVKLSKWYV